MKNLKNFAAAAIMMVLCAALSVLTSCSGSDMDMDERQEPIKPEVSTKVDDTYINHNWAEKENTFVDEQLRLLSTQTSASRNLSRLSCPLQSTGQLKRYSVHLRLSTPQR